MGPAFVHKSQVQKHLGPSDRWTIQRADCAGEQDGVGTRVERQILSRLFSDLKFLDIQTYLVPP